MSVMHDAASVRALGHASKPYFGESPWRSRARSTGWSIALMSMAIRHRCGGCETSSASREPNSAAAWPCAARGVHLNGVATRACATAVDSIRDAAMTTVVLLALLGGPVAIAQTTGSQRSSAGPASPTVPSSLAPDRRLIGSVPVGHRQPHGSDVPSESPNDIEHIGPEDAAVDRKINNICRGC